MKKSIAILFVLLIGLSAVAQKKKKANEILDKVTEINESYKNIEVEFTLTMENKEADINDSKSGLLYIMGDKFKLVLEGQIVISDGENQYTLLMEDEEVMINSLEEEPDAITPNNLLNSYKTNYKSKFIKEEQYKGQTVEVIELTPLKGRTFTKIKVLVAKASKHIMSFSI